MILVAIILIAREKYPRKAPFFLEKFQCLCLWGIQTDLLDLVKELQKCAVNDELILEGIASFEIEATHNMLNLASMLIQSSSAKLEKIHPQQEPKIILQNENVNRMKKELVSV